MGHIDIVQLVCDNALKSGDARPALGFPKLTQANEASIMSKAIKPAAKVTIEERYSVSIVRRVGELEGKQSTINEERKTLVVELAAHYGAALIREAKDGGINFTKPQKDEASRHNVSVATIQEIDEIRQGINKVLGQHGWRDYLRALYPKKVKEAVAPKDEPENIKALKSEKAGHERDAKYCKAQAALAKAAMLTAESDAQYDEAKARMDDANKAAKAYEASAKQCAAEIKETAELNAGADAYGRLHEALTKLGNDFKDHKDVEVSKLAKQVLALL